MKYCHNCQSQRHSTTEHDECQNCGSHEHSTLKCQDCQNCGSHEHATLHCASKTESTDDEYPDELEDPAPSTAAAIKRAKPRTRRKVAARATYTTDTVMHANGQQHRAIKSRLDEPKPEPAASDADETFVDRLFNLIWRPTKEETQDS